MWLRQCNEAYTYIHTYIRQIHTLATQGPAQFKTAQSAACCARSQTTCCCSTRASSRLVLMSVVFTDNSIRTVLQDYMPSTGCVQPALVSMGARCPCQGARQCRDTSQSQITTSRAKYFMRRYKSSVSRVKHVVHALSITPNQAPGIQHC